jgi:hypothetical protein
MSCDVSAIVSSYKKHYCRHRRDKLEEDNPGKVEEIITGHEAAILREIKTRMQGEKLLKSKRKCPEKF